MIYAAVLLLMLLLFLSVLLLLFPGLMGLLKHLLLNGILGLGLLWGCGMLLDSAYRVSISPMSAAVCSLLGIPGAAALLLIRRFF